jgi:phosphoribosylformimino-5-aminoimidazole carboxamide ribotide isomerase
VQLIDLDAAMRRGHNDALVQRAMRELPCQVGGGIRTPAQAQSLIDRGARRVIVGSALFTQAGVDVALARRFADHIGGEQLVAAVDCRHGEVVVAGWTATAGIQPGTAIRALDPFAGAFLCTLVETEGTMQGIDLARIARLRGLTSRGFIAAGGIRTREEIDALEAIGADAVVGMAVYTGTIELR